MTNPLKYWMVEMCSAIPSDSSSLEDAAAPYDSAFSRCALSIPGGAKTVASAVFTAVTQKMWFHAEARPYAFNSGVYDAWEIKNATGTVVFKMTADTFTPSITDKTLALWFYNGSGYTQVGSGCVVSASVRQRLDMMVDPINGLCELKVAGTVQISGSFAVTYVDNFAQVLHHGSDSLAGAWSQSFGATEDTVNLRLMTVTGTANGADQDQASGDYASVDEIVYDDTDFVAFTAAGRFTAKKTTFSTSYLIRGFGVSLRANTTGSGPAHLQPMLRYGGVNYEDPTLHALTGSASVAQYMWGVNPATGITLTSANIAATEFGGHLTA